MEMYWDSIRIKRKEKEEEEIRGLKNVGPILWSGGGELAAEPRDWTSDLRSLLGIKSVGREEREGWMERKRSSFRLDLVK